MPTAREIAEKTAAYDEAMREDAARKNRELFPEAAAFVDAVREHFPGAKVTYLGPVRKNY